MNLDFHLASRSPRRVQMLREAGYRFDALPADVAEVARAGESPAAFARRMAIDKARAAQLRAADLLPVLGADTDVSVDGEILGKPRDRDDAVEMLLRLSDRAHEVHSAVAVVQGATQHLDSTCTQVVFGPVTRDDALAYWESGEPVDKAGAYAVQGIAARWVREIRGSYSGVVGLPLFETVRLLARVGVKGHAR